MTECIRVGFIGCGKRARAHAAGVRADERLEVVALADIKPEAAQGMKNDFGWNAVIYADYREMLREQKPTVVFACLPTPIHLPAFRDCAESGVRAVLSEKPMAPTWGESREMARWAEKTGCQLTFCHQRRFAEGNRLVRRLIEEGRLGDILRMDLYSPPHLLDCGTHTLDQAIRFNGETPARWVMGAVDLSKPINFFGVPAESTATGTVVFENGVRAALQVGGPDMDLWGGVRVTGSKGFVEVFWDGQFRNGVLYAEPDWTPPVIEADTEGQMVHVVRDAIDAMIEGREPELSYRKALRATEIIFALYESARRHTRVELPLAGVDDNPVHVLLDRAAQAV